MELEFRDIYKNFGEKEVLKGISFTAKSGRAFGLLGRNGAGKSTSLRILMDVFPFDKGEIFIDGQKIDYNKIQIGYLPEERGLYPKKKIIDQLTYFSMLKGMDKKSAVKANDFWLERLDMMEYRNKKLETLSKGNQQKIQLITALAHEPDIIILDEPFSGLDPVNARQLKEVVEDEIKKGKIVIFSSHQMNYIEEFCDSIAIINQGEIVLHGELREIKRSYPRNKIIVSSCAQNAISKEIPYHSSLTADGKLLIQLENENDKADLMADLCKKYDIDELKVFEPSLNDIFVEFSKEETGGQNETV